MPCFIVWTMCLTLNSFLYCTLAHRVFHCHVHTVVLTLCIFLTAHRPRHINSFTHMAASHCLDKWCNSSFSAFKLLQHAMCLYGQHSQTGIHFTSLLCYCDKDQSWNLKSSLQRKPSLRWYYIYVEFFQWHLQWTVTSCVSESNRKWL